MKARLLLDSCSQATLVSEDFVRRFKLKLDRVQKVVSGINNAKLAIKFCCRLTVSSRFENYALQIEPEVIANFGYIAPERLLHSIQRSNSIDRFGEIPHANGRVDILLGAEFVEKCLINSTRQIGDLVVRDTTLGATIIGRYTGQHAQLSHCNMVSDDQLCKFWELEECSYEPAISDEHRECDSHFNRTHTRDKNGRFLVRLPFKVDPVFLADTRSNALAHYKRNETKLDIDTRKFYNEFLAEYLARGEMEVALNSPSNNQRFYLPHHAVIKETSTTTKLRVVFNASARNATCISLNGALMVGQQIQPNLFDTLIRFHSFRYAFTADIEKMYRQVALHEADREFHCIFWRSEENMPIREYRLSTLTYDTAPASFIATRCLVELANNLDASDPRTAVEIRRGFYMGDLMSGADSEEEAVRLRSTIHNALDSACFPLRKYLSNSAGLLNSINNQFIERTKGDFLFKDESDTTQLLGLLWNSHDDTLKVRVNLPHTIERVTKRIILSEVSRVFDPLVILAPFTISAKILLQELWREKLSWDTQVSGELSHRYLNYRTDLLRLQEYEIPHCYKPVTVQASAFQLHGFSDASERAYAAVVYFRCVLTIPRLELSGALLLSELLRKIAQILTVKSEDIHAYTDSTVVLGWLRSPPETWGVFIANRVQKIIEQIPAAQWEYVNTKLNPADLASRGVRTDEFLANELWKFSPGFLKEYTYESGFTELADLPERCSIVTLAVTNPPQTNFIVDCFSTYIRMISTIAYVRHFQPRNAQIAVELAPQEVHESERAII